MGIVPNDTDPTTSLALLSNGRPRRGLRLRRAKRVEEEPIANPSAGFFAELF
jgi:hypothetical protein